MNKNLQPLIIAHRGESFLAPENTLAAINLAWKSGVKAVEIDVRLSQDKNVVVIHDSSTKRTGNIARTIKKSSIEDLKAIDVGSYKADEYKNEKIPLLSEVLNTIPTGCKLIIEIKCGTEIIPYLKLNLDKARIEIDQIELIAFNYELICEAKRHMPEFKMLWLLNLDYYLPAWAIFLNTNKLITKIKEKKLDGINVWAGSYINAEFVAACKRHELFVYTWTIDNVNKASQLFNMGVDAVTSNRASWMSKMLINK